MLQRNEAPVRLFSFALAGLMVASLGAVARSASPQSPAARGGPAAESLLDEFYASPVDGRTLRAVERDAAVREQMLRAEVASELSAARHMMDVDPQAVVRDLKMLLDTLRVVTGVNASVRSQLSGEIEQSLRTAQGRGEKKAERDRLLQQATAARLAKRHLRDQLERDQDKLKRLVEQFNSLVAEGEHQWAEEIVGREVERLDRPAVLRRGLIRTARLSGNHRNAVAIRDARRQGLIAALHQVERSAVPTSDEPPIIFPDAEIWEELTLRRVKYAAVDLSTSNRNEAKIVSALKDQTDVEFLETPLADVISLLKEMHGIEIQLDRSLDDAGIGPDTPVTRNLKGISLRSALRLILRDLELTYVIRHEVLLIMTPDAAGANLITRAYPVIDLVVPIPDARTLGGGALGGFGMGNNQGGQQGNQGGNDLFGGQNNGFGQGQGQQFGQGMGPGF